MKLIIDGQQHEETGSPSNSDDSLSAMHVIIDGKDESGGGGGTLTLDQVLANGNTMARTSSIADATGGAAVISWQTDKWVFSGNTTHACTADEIYINACETWQPTYDVDCVLQLPGNAQSATELLIGGVAWSPTQSSGFEEFELPGLASSACGIAVTYYDWAGEEVTILWSPNLNEYGELFVSCADYANCAYEAEHACCIELWYEDGAGNADLCSWVPCLNSEGELVVNYAAFADEAMCAGSASYACFAECAAIADWVACAECAASADWASSADSANYADVANGIHAYWYENDEFHDYYGEVISSDYTTYLYFADLVTSYAYAPGPGTVSGFLWDDCYNVMMFDGYSLVEVMGTDGNCYMALTLNACS